MNRGKYLIFENKPLTKDIWENLDENNKISLYVRYIDLATGEYESRIVNKNN